ncbi:unnamed protein product [Withania somnifera]
MEVHKRKCMPGEEVEVKKHIKTEKGEGKSVTATAEVVVEDDEVEEFYAILRRIRVAVKYFEKGTSVYGDAGRNLTAAQPRKMGFQQGDFKRCVAGDKERESVEDNAGLDLNTDPNSDPNSEAY